MPNTKHKQIENSIFTSSKNYDPIKSLDIIRVRIADGTVTSDNRFKYFGRSMVAAEERGTREFIEIERIRRTQRSERAERSEERRLAAA